MTPVRLEPTAPGSRVKLSTTDPLRSHKMHLTPPPLVASAAVRSKAVVLLLLTCCLLLLTLCESVIVLYFVVRYFMSILVLQSS